jgi:hypothetical protein
MEHLLGRLGQPHQVSSSRWEDGRWAVQWLQPDPNLDHACFIHAGIRLAGATNDVHIFDIRTGTWVKITPMGEPPSPRAAHAAAAVGNMVVVQVRSSAVVQRSVMLCKLRIRGYSCGFYGGIALKQVLASLSLVAV